MDIIHPHGIENLELVSTTEINCQPQSVRAGLLERSHIISPAQGHGAATIIGNIQERLRHVIQMAEGEGRTGTVENAIHLRMHNLAVASGYEPFRRPAGPRALVGAVVVPDDPTGAPSRLLTGLFDLSLRGWLIRRGHTPHSDVPAYDQRYYDFRHHHGSPLQPMGQRQFGATLGFFSKLDSAFETLA
jgi:hypothetical protein